MEIQRLLASFVLVPRCTQCFFWTFPALDLALDPGTRLKEFRRWTMGSSRFFLSYSKQNSKGQQYQYNEYCDYFHHLPGDWIDNVSTSTSASWRHRPLLCSVQVWLSKKIDHKNSKKKLSKHEKWKQEKDWCIREARVVTTRTIPIQVDGEAVRLNPCTIEITHLNKV